MKTKTMITALMIMTSFTSFAAGDVGNGGGVHYCGKRSQQELYDLYEGRERYDIDTTDTQNLSVKEYLEIGVEKLKKVDIALAYKVDRLLEWMTYPNSVKFKNTVLTKVPDANILMRDEGCSYEQLANWDDATGKLFVKKDLFDSLSAFNQAAFFMHEAVYKVARDLTNTSNSDASRKLVAEIMSPRSFVTSTYFLTSKLPTRIKVSDGAPSAADVTVTKTSYKSLDFNIHLGDIDLLKDFNNVTIQLADKYHTYKEFNVWKKAEGSYYYNSVFDVIVRYKGEIILKKTFDMRNYAETSVVYFKFASYTQN